MWRNADPVLQPYVREAREGLARLAGENAENVERNADLGPGEGLGGVSAGPWSREMLAG
jgi:hypothetical protein